MRLLTLLETRVLGALIEKEHTVPDSYPLSLNSLVAACNQKTSRDPVINASEADVQAAVESLKELALITESSGAKVMRFGHNAERGLKLPSQSVALLAMLMLRGPQTAAELRINSDRLHKFADTGSVEVFLNELASRAETAGGPLVQLLPKAPGAREARWMHLLSGAPDVSAAADMLGGDALLGADVDVLKAEVRRLHEKVAKLETTLAKVCSELGIGDFY
jgi:uncharacterized protein